MANNTTPLDAAAEDVRKRAGQIFHLLCSMEDAVQKVGLLCEGTDLEDRLAEPLERIIVLGRMAKTIASETEELSEAIESGAGKAGCLSGNHDGHEPNGGL